MNTDELRREILKLTAEYARQRVFAESEYHEGDRIHYASRTYDEEEVVNAVDAALEFWLTSGHFTQEFEKALGDYLGLPFVSFVNSGSSANLLAFAALTSPLLKERQIRPGDEVITVAAGFPTTVAPILQSGAVPVFLDVTIPGYNLDVSMLAEALSDRTKAVMVAHTLGNPIPLAPVLEFCRSHGLWLIEDNCDALGSTYTLNGKTALTGTFGDIASSSFYPPHHMTTGEGGAVYTADPLLHRIVRSLRDWGRDCVCEPGQDDRCGHRFSRQFGELPEGYDHKYVYSHLGYNLKATDLQASIGCAQIKKLPAFTKRRKENFAYLTKLLTEGGAEEYVILPRAEENSDPSWFGFLMTLKETGRREAVVRYVEEHKVQTRLLFAGNLLRQPCFDDIRGREGAYRVVGTLANTDRIMNDSFWVGLYPGMTEEKLRVIASVLLEAFRN